MSKIGVQLFQGMGRGVMAGQSFKAGDIVEQCEVLVLSQDDTIKVNQTDLRFYTFVYNETQDCLVLGCGELYNHSEAPNVSYKLVSYNGRMLMQFSAIKDIAAYDQLFIDYTADSKVDAKAYKTNLY